METSTSDIDLDLLFKLRLLVARYGEMDVAKWWNTNGVLGQYGAMAISRGLPKTHYFAQARIVFSVARSRCKELFDPPACMTLWDLPPRLEDKFESRWQHWLDQSESWVSFFETLQSIGQGDLLQILCDSDLLSGGDVQKVHQLHLSSESRAVPIPGMYTPNNEILRMLAGGFSLASTGNLAVPYARLEKE